MPGAARQIGMMQVIGLDPHRDEAAEQRLEYRGIDPPWLGDRHTGMKANDGEMRDRLEPADDGGDAARRQQKRVAASDDGLPDLGMLADVAEGPVERRRREHAVAL